LAPESQALRFAPAITCLDGRVQRPVVDYMRRTYGVDYVDLITEPGPEWALTDPTRAGIQAAIHRNARFSVEGHDAELIAVTAHDDCLGNDADSAKRLAQLRAAQQVVTGWPGRGCHRALGAHGREGGGSGDRNPRATDSSPRSCPCGGGTSSDSARR
jgi:carbonic anhydrase-like protein